ncbi:MAG TPA: hypothetical protein VGA73_02730 [Candidatus Binatia bacterium]
MSHDGSPNWPPRWMPREAGKSQLHGEIGVLQEVAAACGEDELAHQPSQVFLFMEHEGVGYVTALPFGDSVFCGQIGRLLKQHYRRTLEEIGRLDVGHLL